MRATALVGLALPAVLALCASSASAQPALTWHAPPGCPDEASLIEEIAALAPGTVARGSIEARVAQEGDRWRARIVSADGTRELEGRSCATVTSAVALVIATAMVVPRPPLRGAAATALESSAEESVAPPSAVSAREPLSEDDSAAEPIAEDRGDDGLRFVVGGQTGMSVGPGVDAVAMVTLGIRAEGFEAGMAWSRIVRFQEPDRDTDRATFRLAWVLGLAPFEVAFRVLGELYSSFHGIGNERRGVLWGALGIGLELRLWIEEVAALVLSWDSTVPVSRTPAHLMGPERVEDVPVFVGTLAGGVLFQIP